MSTTRGLKKTQFYKIKKFMECSSPEAKGDEVHLSHFRLVTYVRKSKTLSKLRMLIPIGEIPLKQSAKPVGARRKLLIYSGLRGFIIFSISNHRYVNSATISSIPRLSEWSSRATIYDRSAYGMRKILVFSSHLLSQLPNLLFCCSLRCSSDHWLGRILDLF